MKALTLKNDSNDLNQIFANINPFLTSKNPSKKLQRIKHGNHSRTLSVGREKSVNLNNINELKEALYLNASKIDNQSANLNNEEFSNFENNFEILQNESFLELKNISPDESFKEKPEFKILTASEKEKRNFSNGEEMIKKLEEHICKNEILKHKIKDLTEKYIIDLSKKEKEINELKGYRDYYLNLNRKYELITKKKKNEVIQEKDHLFIENLQKENNLLKIENLRINEENRVINKKLQFTEKQLLLNKENVDSLKKEKDEFIKKMKYLIIKLKNVEKENGFLQKKQSENKTLITSLQNEISHHIDTITQMAHQNRKIEEIDEMKPLEEKNSPENILKKIPKKPPSNKHSSFTFNKGTGTERNHSANKRISLDHNKKTDSNLLITKPETKNITSSEIKNEEENLKNSSENIQKEINESNKIEQNYEEEKEKDIPIDLDRKITSKKSIISKKSSTILNNIDNDSNIKNITEKNNDIINNENSSVNDEILHSRNSIIFKKKTTLPEIKSKNEIALDKIEGHVENKNISREESLKEELIKSNESIKFVKKNSQFSVRSLKNSKNLEKILTPMQRKESGEIISNLINNSINIEREKKQDENTNGSQNLEKRFSKKSIQSIRSQKSRENRKSQNLENEIDQETQIDEKKEEEINLTLNIKAKASYDDMVIINNDNKLEEKEEITENIEKNRTFPEEYKENKTQEVLNDIIIKEEEHTDDKVPLKKECLVKDCSENNSDDKKLDDISDEQNFANFYLKSMIKTAVDVFLLESEKENKEKNNYEDSTNGNALEKKDLAVDLEKDVSFYIQSLTKNSISLYPFHSVQSNRENEEENIKISKQNSFEKEKQAHRKQDENAIVEELINSHLEEIEVKKSNAQNAELPDLEEDFNKNYKKISAQDENDLKDIDNKKMSDNDQEKQQSVQNEEEVKEKINNTNEKGKSKEENQNNQQLSKEYLENKNEHEIDELKFKTNIIENELIVDNENEIEELIIKDDFTKKDLENLVNQTLNKKDSITSQKKLFLVNSEHNEIIDLSQNEKLKNPFEEEEEDIENEKPTQSKESEQIYKFESKNFLNNQSQIDEIKTQKVSEENLQKKNFCVNYQDDAEKLKKDNNQNEFEDNNLDQEVIKKNDHACTEQLEENNLIFRSDINLENPNKIEDKKNNSTFEEKNDFDHLANSNENVHQSIEVKHSIEVVLEKKLSSKTQTNIDQKIIHSLDQNNNNMESKFEAIEESALIIKNKDLFKNSNVQIEKELQTEENEEELDLKPENIESPRNEQISRSIEKQKKEKKELMSSNIKSKGKVNTRYEKENESEKIKTIKFLVLTDISDSKTFCRKICDEMDFKFIIFAEGLTIEKIWQELKNDSLLEVNPPCFFLLEIMNNEDIDPTKFFREFTYDYLFCIRREDTNYKNAFEGLEKYFVNENKVIISDLSNPEAFKNIIREVLEKLEK